MIPVITEGKQRYRRNRPTEIPRPLKGTTEGIGWVFSQEKSDSTLSWSGDLTIFPAPKRN